MDSYEGDRAVVGEVGDAQYAMRIMREYTSGDQRAHMCYAFDFLGCSTELSASQVWTAEGPATLVKLKPQSGLLAYVDIDAPPVPPLPCPNKSP